MNFELLAPAVDNSIGVFGRLEESGSISTKIVIWVMMDSYSRRPACKESKGFSAAIEEKFEWLWENQLQASIRLCFAESSTCTGMTWNRYSTCDCGCALAARGKEGSNAAQETGPGGIFWGGGMGAMLPMSQTRSGVTCTLMVLKIFRMSLSRHLIALSL